MKGTAVPPVQNQGGCGACWIFSTIGAYEFNFAFDAGSGVNAAEQRLMNCASTPPCDGGFFEDACTFMKNTGTFARTDPGMIFDPSNLGTCTSGDGTFKAVNFDYVLPVPNANNDFKSHIPPDGALLQQTRSSPTAQ